jgi:hypothetical protein
MKHATRPRTIAVMVATSALGLQLSAQMQQVIAGAGSYFSNASGSIAFTIGEPVIATQTSGGIIITQGFHQPEDEFSTTAPALAPASGIAVFPNPTRDEVFVTLTGSGTGWTCTLYDLCGKITLQQVLPAQRNTLDLSAFANGPYALHVVDANGQLARTFQLIIAK